MFEDFPKSCTENSSFLKIWQEKLIIYIKDMYIYDNVSVNSSQNEKCLRQNL